MSRWAPDNADGLHAYVVTTMFGGRSYDSLVYEASLSDAKTKHGYKRMLPTHIRVHRAAVADVPGAVGDRQGDNT